MAIPNLLSIVCSLLEGERSVAEIESELGIRRPTLSQQLGELREAGLAATRRGAKHVYYRVADDRAAGIVATLREVFSQPENWCERLPPRGGPERRISNPIDLTLYD